MNLHFLGTDVGESNNFFFILDKGRGACYVAVSPLHHQVCGYAEILTPSLLWYLFV